MKRLFFLSVIICMVQFVNAQAKPDSIPVATEKPGKGPYITLQAGQVLLIKENKAEKLLKDQQLTDGTVVTTNGNVKRTDGTSMQMKEGDRIYLDGGMSVSRKDKNPMK